MRFNSPVKVYESETFRALAFVWLQTCFRSFRYSMVADVLAASAFTAFALHFGRQEDPDCGNRFRLMNIVLALISFGLCCSISALRYKITHYRWIEQQRVE